MTKTSKKIPAIEKKQSGENSSLFRGDVLAKGIVTGIVVSTINHTGRTIMRSITRHPLLIFGLGFATGYFTYKYRQEIISAANNVAEQSKNFVLRQKKTSAQSGGEKPGSGGNKSASEAIQTASLPRIKRSRKASSTANE